MAVSAGIGIGVTVVGNLIINALVPPPRPDKDRRTAYSISGWRNRPAPDGAVQPVSPQQSYSFALGDTTGSNLVTAGAMGDPGAWDADARWGVAGGQATHTPGTADDLSQAQTLTSGK